jgi:DNA-binding SARP family transcriptional activator
MSEDSVRSGLFLRTLGGAALLDADGREVRLQRKQLAVLVLLRLLPAGRLNRAELERLLWLRVPGDPSNSLSQALGPLRDHLPDLSKGKGPLAWPGRHALACDVDVLMAGDGGPEARRAAIAAYRGVFLKDFTSARRPEAGEEEFRHWVDQQQERYEAVFRRLLADEAAEAEGAGCWQEVERLARSAIDVDRHWPHPHALLLRALAGSGQPEAARRHFDALVRQLQADAEPGEEVEADPEVADAYAQIDALSAAAAAAAARARPAAVPPAPAPVREDPPAARATVESLVPLPAPRGAAERPGTHRGGRWRTRRLVPLAALGVGGVFALALYGKEAAAGRDRDAFAAPQPAALAPLCQPGEMRATLVEQDFKADPVNVVQPNTHFTTVWHLQNAGRCTWPASLRLRRISPKVLSISDREIPAQKAVPSGDTIQFPAPMVAPGDTGRFDETWELLDAGGHRVPVGEGRGTLAAAIRVLDGPPPPCRPADVQVQIATRGYVDDSRVRPGSRFTYEWTFMNRAPGCSLDQAYALRFVSASPARMSSPAADQIPITQPVIPSHGYTFEIPMQAPSRPGTFTESWRLVYRDGRTVPIEGFQSAGLRLVVHDDTAAVPEVPYCKPGEYAIAFMNTERPEDESEIPAGTRFVKKWTVANRGRCTWESGLRLHYVRAKGGRRSVEPSDVVVGRPVAPRESYTFSVPIRVPRRPGLYAEYWSAISPAGDTIPISLTKVIWTEVMVTRR